MARPLARVRGEFHRETPGFHHGCSRRDHPDAEAVWLPEARQTPRLAQQTDSAPGSANLWGPIDSLAVSRQRSSALNPEPPSPPAVSATGIERGPDDSQTLEARSENLRAVVALAQEHANLGLPVAPSERFRFAERLVARVCWTFLRHQVAFNEATVEAIRELSGHVSRLEQRVKDDLLDFADRSASQAQAEITDQVADARSMHADLILELRTLQAELDAVLKEGALDRPLVQGRPAPDERRHAAGDGDGEIERR